MSQDIKDLNKDIFFREMTLRICSSLDIGKALHRCFLFLNDMIPMEELIVVTYDNQLGAINIEAVATRDGGIEKGIKIPLNDKLQNEIESAVNFPRIRYVSDLHKDSMLSPLGDFFGWVNAHAVVVRFIIEKMYMGAFIIITKDDSINQDRYLKLLELINEPVAIALNNCKQYKELKAIKDALAEERQFLHNELEGRYKLEVIGADFGLKDVMDRVNKVAPLSSPVLLYGETGTGKEIISQVIHSLSHRANGPFIKINCGAIPDTLIDSELFGHEKGSFTGAISQKKGRFERADNGTIFLDEISELPLNAQVRLLRVLQEKEFERVGGTTSIKVDVRVISATNRNLEELVDKGLFREDLYFRLNVFPINIPALRERKGDIPALLQHFIMKKFRDMALPHIPVVDKGAINILMSYDWPGNVRELENIVERAIILSKGRPLDFRDILQADANINKAYDEMDTQMFMTLEEIERDHILNALKISKGKVEGNGGAAELLNINPGTLRHRMRKLRIPFGRKVS
ncbi:MAG TPA: sigma 54-interacting transcriptional regulator [Syntrophorhabdaceae bacterium]|nr:sigma 54-interacting transcriptional regulator [Syntrophorhabdaceae bacterium]